MKKACLTGITGQTGSYLAELLLEEGYEVHGLKRSSSNFNTQRIDHIYEDPNLHLVYGDLADYSSLCSFVSNIQPDLFFNCGALSHVRVSFDIPEYTMDITGTGVIRCLEAIRRYSPHTRFLQCSTSELYGSTPPPQDESTPFHPRSPYACAKMAGYWSTINYREAYGMFAVNAISFNHESPRRGENFVTRKITRAATRIKLGLQKELKLGNLDAKRDWGHAKDTARAMYLMLTADDADDYVVATGEMHSVKEFLELVFSKLDMDWKDYVVFDPKYMRPSEVDALGGNPNKIRDKLGWVPKLSFEDLVQEMIDHDMELARQEKILKDSNE
jgi:GDPmannose 4,6-dehydratase